MNVTFEPQALAVADGLFESDDPAYDKIWDVLDRIADDPEEAKHAPWTEYVSTREVWGTKIPGAIYTAYWRTGPDKVVVVYLFDDRTP